MKPTPPPADFPYPTAGFTEDEFYTFEETLALHVEVWGDSRQNFLNLSKEQAQNAFRRVSETIDHILTELPHIQSEKEPPYEIILQTPAEVDGVILAYITGKHAAKTNQHGFGKESLETQDLEKTFSKFLADHWLDNPLEEYWWALGNEPPTDPILETIAKQGSREHVLRELEARYNHLFRCSAYENPKQFDTERGETNKLARKFIERWDEIGRSMPKKEYNRWLSGVESAHGHIADGYLNKISTSSNTP